MAILLTGFRAFPGAPANPTEDLVRDFKAAQATFKTALLPVDWRESWPALKAAIEEAGARRVVMFGLAASAPRIRIERTARNRRDGRADAAGTCADGAVIEAGPEALSCRLPEKEIGEALKRSGIDFEWSQDAGAYLCNDTLYRLANHAGDLGVEDFFFVHVPLSEERVADWQAAGAWRDDQPSVPAATIRRAAEAIVEALTQEGPHETGLRIS